MTGIIAYSSNYYCNKTFYYVTLTGYQNHTYNYYLSGFVGYNYYYAYDYWYYITYQEKWYISSNNCYYNGVISGYTYAQYYIYVANMTCYWYTTSTYMGLIAGYGYVYYVYLYNISSNVSLYCVYGAASWSLYAKSNVSCS